MRGKQPWRTNRSRVLRSRPISAETKPWSRLRDRQLGGHKFTPQTPIDPYFVDFVCRERKVIVEVARDHRRTRHLETLGYPLFRISNDDIYHNLDCALDAFIENPR